MWTGFCPPSYAVLRLLPERAPAPLWPRPDVFPWPVPTPRPRRLRGRRDPGVGFKVWRPTFSDCSAILDLHEVADRADHALQLRGVGMLRLAADAAELQGAKGGALHLRGAVRGSDLPELYVGHQEPPPEGASSPPPTASAEASFSAPAAGAATSFGVSSSELVPLPTPSTSRMEMPRSF